MSRLALVLVSAMVLSACAGGWGNLPAGDRSSAARLAFDEGSTSASGGILAFDPSRHSMDISISIPLAQEDLDVYIVTSRGVRFQVLESFQNCDDNGESRSCARWLPMFPNEEIDNWQVEAERVDDSVATYVAIDVTWVPIGG